MRRFLHVGCGAKRQAQTTPGLASDQWQELRFDIDEAVRPDILGTMLDMSMIENSQVDAIFSSHNIEHLYPHEVPVALSEFKRVLSEDGFAIITCPDLQSVCELVAQDKLMEPAYVSPAGPISPIDILFGHRPAMARGNLFMAHRTGFTQSSIKAALLSAGFATVATMRMPSRHELWAVATMRPMQREALHSLALAHFPKRA
jgi:hypothetical protein